MGRLDGKRAVVVGAAGAGNMGQVIARRLAAEGASVLVAGRRAETLEALAGEISGHFHVCDITDCEAVFSLESQAAEKLGGCDILVNAAQHLRE
ncbi:MAG: SDR family NAD(P)-dependent oxidoreductase, partial [Pseudomonadota bacterium]